MKTQWPKDSKTSSMGSILPAGHVFWPLRKSALHFSKMLKLLLPKLQVGKCYQIE